MGEGKIARVIQGFDSHAEADQANFEYYRSLTPEQRIELALDLMAPYYEAYPRFQRIYRTAELGECPVTSDWRLGV